jgi:hypothetical protein
MWKYSLVTADYEEEASCGCAIFTVLRSGMDIKIRCEGCGREVMVPRVKIERNIKSVEHPGEIKQV